MNKVEGGRLTELWSGERKRGRDLKMMVWVSRFLRWAAPRIMARRGRLSRQEMNYAREEEKFASLLSLSPWCTVGVRCFQVALFWCYAASLCVTRVKLAPHPFPFACCSYDHIPRAISNLELLKSAAVLPLWQAESTLEADMILLQKHISSISIHAVLLFGRRGWSRWITSSEHRVFAIFFTYGAGRSKLTKAQW